MTPPARTTTASPGRICETGTRTSPCPVRTHTRSTLSDIQRARSATDFFRVHSSSSSPTSNKNITIPAVPKSFRQTEMETDRASSSSTFICLWRRQPSPRFTNGIICHRIRAIRRGDGRNSVLAALYRIFPASFSSNSRFKALLLWAGSAVVSFASFHEKCRSSSSMA